ncbi:MAG: hypothetical protein JWL62_1193 [Hyphomicrobiales bacterium]|nr:hypothetical protein [Hyphomicrobiales bacterium]
MSEAIHEVAHEATHEAAHSAKSNAKWIGLLISILALFLAVSEMLGKSAQTHGLALNIQASDTWNFFQAKTIRQTVLRTALENARIEQPGDKIALDKQMAAWQANIDRWESEPATSEGRKELVARAKHIEHERDVFLGQYHAYEIASLFIQLGIVLASVALLSSLMGFALGSGLMGAGGIALLAGTYFNVPFIMALLH